MQLRRDQQPTSLWHKSFREPPRGAWKPPRWSSPRTTSQLCNAINARAGRGAIFRRDQLRNPVLWLALAAVLAIQVTVVYLPWAQTVFGTVALSAGQGAICAAAAATVLLVEETVRLINRRRSVAPADTTIPARRGYGLRKEGGVGDE